MRDPRRALEVTRAGLEHQHRLGQWTSAAVSGLEQLRAENHIADRFEALLRARR